MTANQKEQKGFTLIEIIITLVIAALMGAVIFAYMGPALTRSHEPVVHVGNLGEAVAAMEDVTVEYQRYLSRVIQWTAFTTWLDDEGLTYANIKNTGGLSDEFDILEVTITRGNQTVSALFTQ